MNKIDKAVEELNEYLDTFYTDSEGWMELADIYSSCHQSVSFPPSLLKLEIEL
jgi:hemerythrin